ncbi:MAG: glycoside hydrolase [Treponema sp.]|nr:glycoside hydrolase [Treponema sp.]
MPPDADTKDDIEDIDISISLPNPEEPLPVSAFGEIWGYVVTGREAALVNNLPLSDIGYFSAEVDSYGKLIDIPKRRNLKFSGRVHLVAVCSGRALSHFVLNPASHHRRELIDDLLTAAKDFDGLQIDFENIPGRDADTFLSFLKELRQGLPTNKMFTIALPARTRKINDDQYDYEKIKPYVDRILIMAYDEHWSGSKPGSVASIKWCKQVADYSLKVIGKEKLIMGLPFYGRAWGDYNPSRALIYTSTEKLIDEHNVTEIRREDGIPVFEYSKNVSITVYYEDEYSLCARMNMYKTMGIASIGFWRLGQETPKVWEYIKLVK